MKLGRPLLTLMGAFTAAGLVAAAILFFFAPALLQEEDQLEKADAIVVLGGGYYRPMYGADLFLQGYAPRLLVSKPVTSPEKTAVRDLGIDFPYQWEIYERILKQKGIADKDFNFFGSANVSTLEEAEKLKPELAPEIKSIILVTSPLHTRRAGIIFREKLPAHKVIVVSPPYEQIPSPWWKNYRAAPLVLLEVAKTVYYKFGGGFRSSEQLKDY